MDVYAASHRDETETIDEAERIVQYVYDLRRPRRKLKTDEKRRRLTRIGDRDGWICRNYAEPVDRTLVIPDRRAYDAYLKPFGPADLPGIVAWVGGDLDKAAAVAHAGLAPRYLGAQPLADWLADRRNRDPRVPEYADLSDAQRRGWDHARERVVTLVRRYQERNGASASIEHRLPVTLGGTDADGNLALSHLRCNTHHGSRSARNQAALDAVKAVELFRRDCALWRDGQMVSPELMAENFERICVWLQQEPAHQHVLDPRVRVNLADALRASTSTPHEAR
jgi:hypothetical protein